MTVAELKKQLEQFDDNDYIEVQVHDTCLYEDIYEFYLDPIKMDTGYNNVYITPIENKSRD